MTAAESSAAPSEAITVDSRQEIRPLTGLRGVAALAVAFYHFRFAYPASGGVLSNVVNKLYLSVDLFFVLSGLVMAMTYAHLFQSPFRPTAYVDFWLRRIARIYPLYLFALCGGLAYGLAVHGERPGAATLAANLLLVQAWGLSASIPFQAWSISAECAAYALFPLLVAAVLDASAAWAFVSAAAAAACLATVVLVAPLTGEPMTGPLGATYAEYGLPVLRCLGGFVLGMLCHRVARRPDLARLAASPLLGALVVFALCGLSCRGSPDWLCYPLLVLLVLHLSVGRGWVSGMFAGRLPHRLGLLSYAVYLMHGFMLGVLAGTVRILSRYVPAPAAAALGVAAVLVLLLAVSQAVHTVLEVPGRAYVRSLRGRMLPMRYAKP